MPATLQIIPASAAPFEIQIGDIASIGRLPDSTVYLSSDPVISRQHAVIRSSNGIDYQIVDLGSLNGTYLNGHRVVLPATLEDGARIKIADNELIFERNADSSAQDQQSTLLGSISRVGNASTFVALMVCDIRGFTAATEIFSKSDLAQTLGHWFREATHLVQQGGGHIDKFVGDSFLAYWVKQETGPSECEAAFDAGCKLLELAKATTWPDPGRPFQIVVALHCGQVAYRNIGVVAERDASIIGDAVNTVFRLESLTKELGQQLLTSREFLAALPSTDAFTDMGERMLKGKSHPVQVFGYNS